MKFQYHFKEMARISVIILIAGISIASCSFPGRAAATPGVPIDAAVATTLASVATRTPAPLPTIIPTATPLDLKGLFCEYQFCIGHPQDMAFYDVNAQQNVGSPSTYSAGILASYNANLFLQVMWQISPGTSDPSFLLNLILDAQTDTRSGNQEVKLIRDMNVIYTPISSTASPSLPHGGAAAWTCGDRVFAWKAYTPDESSAAGLFEEALTRFNCNK
ncbi:MAG: hypothetical protein ACM3XO_23430 [Bacteroidota bacterium]